MTPLFIIFLTIFVNLVGFGIIIPLLPFYAQTFGASPLVIGLLFASFSLSQLVAAPLLGDLSDRWGRRPVLIFSLLGTVVSFVMLALAQSLAMLFAARIVDGLSGGNITTARAYIADVTTDENRAKSFGLLGAAFGLGFIVGPALGAAFSRHQLHGADLGRRGDHGCRRRRSRGSGCRRRCTARRPAGGRPGAPSADLWRPAAPAACSSRLISSTGRRLPSTRRRSRCSARGDLASTPRTPATCSVRSGFSASSCRERWSVRLSRRSESGGRSRIGLLFAAAGWGGSALTHSLPVFVAMLVPGAIGIGLCNATLSALISKSAGRDEQGRVQGAAGALESLGRTIGPGLGQRNAAAVRRRHRVRVGRRRAPRCGRADVRAIAPTHQSRRSRERQGR